MVAAAPSVQSPLLLKRNLMNKLKVVLGRVYGGEIVMLQVEVAQAGNLVSGLFRDRQKLIEFTFDFAKNAVNYNFSTSRSDSWLEGFLSVEHQDRREPANCGEGLSCGLTCIDPNETCRLKLGSVMTGRELRQAKSVAVQLHKAISESEADRQSASGPDRYADMNIRTLQKEATERGVYRSHHMNSEELRRTLRTLDQEPGSQERLRKTLEKQREAKRQARSVTRGVKPVDPLDVWNKLEKLSKLASVDPKNATIIAAGLLAGIASTSYMKMRDRYKEGLAESAQMALQRADQIPVEGTLKPNLMFAVGGFSSTGSSGVRLKEQLETPANATEGEQWFRKKNHVIPFDHPEFDIPPTAASQKNEDGSYNAAYLGHVAVNSFGKYIQNFRRGRNEAAVDLAAQLYAHGARYSKAGLNVVGHGSGGNVTNEAVEILSRMQRKDGKGPSGADIAKRLNIVNLGTPSFGFVGGSRRDRDGKLWREINHRTITSGGDPFSILPKRASQWISQVKGHEIGDYLKVDEVRDRLREAFGFYDSSNRAGRNREARRKAANRQIGLAFLAAGQKQLASFWTDMETIRELGKDYPEAAAIATGALAVGASRAAYMYANKRRSDGLYDAAKTASIEVESLKQIVPNVQNSNYMFVVGGTDAPGQDVYQELLNNLPPGSPERDFFESSHHVISADPDSRHDTPDALKDDGLMQDAYAIKEGFGRVLGQSVMKGQNNDAIRLAAQMYVYGIKKQKQGHLPINVLAYGEGGLVARQAVEILKRMTPRNANDPKGEDLLKRIRVVTLGTPGFGIQYDKDIPELNLMGSGDTLGQLPFIQRGSGVTEQARDVRNHSMKAYMESTDVRQDLFVAFKRNSAHWNKTRPIASRPTPRPRLIQSPPPTPPASPPPTPPASPPPPPASPPPPPASPPRASSPSKKKKKSSP